jgi:DnaA family protein
MMQQLLLELAPPEAPTLANFFAGRNAQAVAALREALAGGERCIYLWGEPGSGKTHLLRAAVNEALALKRNALYVGAPHTGLVPPAGGQGNFPDRDVLAVDDVDRLEAPAQLALFDAFNIMRAAGGCLLAAGAPPAAELALREDLRTRLGSGVSLRLAPLDDEEKAAALTRHAAQRGLRLVPELIAHVFAHCRRDMGTQMAVLDALDRYSLQHQRPVTLPLLREALKQLDL